MRLLLIEDNPADARLIQEMMREMPNRPQLEHATRLEAALERLGQEPFDLVLLDLGLPDAQGLDTLKLTLSRHLGPVVVLTGLDDLAFATQALHAGAQDYLVKGRFDGELLARTLSYSLERSAAEHKIHHLAAIVDSSSEAIIGKNLSGTILSWNQGAERVYGYTAAEMIGQPVSRLLLPGQVDELPGLMSRLKKGEVIERYEAVRRRKDGGKVQVLLRLSPIRDTAGAIIGVSTIAADVSEQRRMERELKELEWLLTKEPKEPTEPAVPAYGDLVSLNTCRTVRDAVGEPVLVNIVRDYLDLLDTSAAVYEINGDYALGIFSSGWCRLMNAASRQLCGDIDNQKALACGRWLCHESCWTKCSKLAVESGQSVDIACEGGIRLYSVPIRTGNQIVGAINFGFGNPPRELEELQELAAKFGVEVGQLSQLAEAYESRPPYVIALAKQRLQASARLLGEIVERRQTEEKLRSSNRNLRMISACNQLLVRATAEAELLKESCRIIVELGQYPIAWIGLQEEKDPEHLTLAAHAGAAADFLASLREVCQGSTSEAPLVWEALHSRRVVVCPDIEANPTVCGCRAAALSHGYKSMTALPLDCDGKNLGVLALYASKAQSFDAAELNILQELAADIAFGMTALRAKAQHEVMQQNLQAAHERLRRSVDANIVGVVIASPAGQIIEANDYYLRMTGFTREEFLAGKMDWRAITPPEWLAADERAIDELRQSGTCTPYEKEYLRRDGTRVPVYLADALLPGAEEHILAFTLDLTERKKIETDLRQVVERLARSNAELRRFNQVAVDRELRMVELKRQVNELSQELGRPRPFNTLAQGWEPSSLRPHALAGGPSTEAPLPKSS